MEKSSNNEITANFLISEYNSLQQRANSYEEIKSKRVNFFLLVIAAIGAIYSTIIDNNSLSMYIYEFTIVFSIFCLILGFLTLKMLIDYSMAIVTFHRRAGRIRRWFVDKEKELNNYVAFEANDDKPTFTMSMDLLHWRGSEGILLLTNSVSIGILTAAIIYQKTTYLNTIIPISFVIGAIFWWFQIFYTQAILKKTQNSQWAIDNINFPSDTNNNDI